MKVFRFRIVVTIGWCLWLTPQPAAAEYFVPGNILVTQNNRLREYTRDGALVQNIAVPYPGVNPFREVADVVVDSAGRAHVLNLASLGNPSYLSSYDPATGAWFHTPIRGGLTTISDQDLAIRNGTTAFTRLDAISLEDFSRTSIPQLLSGGYSEIAVGLDGKVYALNGFFPRSEIGILDPVTFELQKTLQITGPARSADARGIAVTAQGDIFLAGWDGRIYALNENGGTLMSLTTGVNNLLNLDVASDGTLVASSWTPGAIVLTDISLRTKSTINLGSNAVAYVAFVPEPIPAPISEPAGVVLLMLGAVLSGLVGHVRHRQARRA